MVRTMEPRISIVIRARHSVGHGEGYRIEKVVVQTLPGACAPAHHYLPPHVDTRAHARLFYNGRWYPDGQPRPDFQAFRIDMPRIGFVVFSFDPFAQRV